MKIFEGCLLVSDLDGSFFGSGTSLPQRNLDAVRYFMDNGGLFTIATGRSITAAKKNSEKIFQKMYRLFYLTGRCFMILLPTGFIRCGN